MDEIIKKWLQKNGIDPDKISSMSENTLYAMGDVNYIVANTLILGEKKEETISIADVIGYYYQCRQACNDLLMDMSNYFQGNGDSYHSRANGMLEYTSDNIIANLYNSFFIEPIVLNRLHDKCFVGDNGLHRFHVLRLHYLKELCNVQNDEQKQALREKYRIPVVVYDVDLIKTYCSYLLGVIDSDLRLYKEMDSNWKCTGNSVVTNRYSKEEIILDDKQLIEFVNNLLNSLEIETKYLLLARFEFVFNCVPDFGDFVKDNFDLLKEERK